MDAFLRIVVVSGGVDCEIVTNRNETFLHNDVLFSVEHLPTFCDDFRFRVCLCCISLSILWLDWSTRHSYSEFDEFHIFAAIWPAPMVVHCKSIKWNFTRKKKCVWCLRIIIKRNFGSTIAAPKFSWNLRARRFCRTVHFVVKTAKKKRANHPIIATHPRCKRQWIECTAKSSNSQVWFRFCENCEFSLLVTREKTG